MGSDRGDGSATPVPPVSLAIKSEPPAGRPSDPPVRFSFSSAAVTEVTRQDFHSAGLEAAEEGDGAEIEIETVFRQKLAGLRRLPRRDRPHVLTAAREWRQAALRALKEKRAIDRHERYQRRRLLAPAPG